MKMVRCKNTLRNVKLEPGTSATAASSGNAATWIGIDLGTTNSLVGVWQAGKINILENEQGKDLTPSIVSFVPMKDGGCEELVGLPAKEKQMQNMENTIYDAKRMLGRNWDDPVLQKYIKKQYWEFEVKPNENKQPQIMAHGGPYRPIDISARILAEMRKIAERGLNLEQIQQAVITVPAYFTERQRNATIEAAEIAGFQKGNIDLITEPAAAAYAYGVHNERYDGYKILIFDMGGGTFDVTILEVKNGSFTVKSIDGDGALGGRDFDQALYEYCVERIQQIYNRNLRTNAANNKKAREKLRKKCEITKSNLSFSPEDRMDLEDVLMIDNAELIIFRKTFEDHCEHLIQRAMRITDQLVAGAELQPSDIDEVLLVGGSSRIPIIQELMFRQFGKKVNRSMKMDQAVCYGASILAAQKCGIVCKELPRIALIEATPLSIGIENCNGNFIPIIPKNSNIPCNFCEPFRTSENSQKSMSFEIYEGISPIAKNNNFLGQVVIDNLTPGPAGEVKTDLRLVLNKNGQLQCVAIHKEQEVFMDIDYTAKRAREHRVGELLRSANENAQKEQQMAKRMELITNMETEIKQILYTIEHHSGHIPVLRLEDLKKTCNEFMDTLETNKQKNAATFRELEIEFDEFRKAMTELKAPKTRKTAPKPKGVEQPSRHSIRIKKIERKKEQRKKKEKQQQQQQRQENEERVVKSEARSSMEDDLHHLGEAHGSGNNA